MKFIDVYKEQTNCSNSNEVFLYLINTLKDTITKWDYFVNWAKVFDNISNIEIDLNTLNYLVGKDDVESEFVKLLEKHPSIARLVPILVASREKNFKILSKYGYDEFVYEDFSFSSENDFNAEKIDKVVKFAKASGFLDLLSSKRIKSVVDYVIGVEVGLDSNGRKNRTGKLMEDIVEFFVTDICKNNNFDYMTQATASKIKNKWGLSLTVDKSSRKIDFAVFNGTSLYLIETNFYGGGGSKLKSTAGEYKTMFDYWKKDGHKFIWITDGLGWKTTHLPLRETFEYIDHLLNLEMISNKILENIIIDNL